MAQGVALEAVAAPDRITAESVDGYVRFLAKRCGTVTVASYLGQLHMMVSAVWPDRDWLWLCAMQARRHRMAEPVRNKAARIVPQQELLALGCELMVRARAMAMPNDMRARPNHPAILHRDGLMVALLAMRPLRQSNFLGLQLHRQLRGEGKGWVMTLTGDETKSHDRLDMAVPVILLPELQRYLDLYRLRLMDMKGPTNPSSTIRPVGQFLWITRCGTPMAPGGLRKALARHSQARFGHPVNVHLFRDCVATSLGDDDPEHVRIAADLPGHKTFHTTETIYIAPNQRHALRVGQNLILARRKAAGRPGNKSSRSR
jgi:hypothetical protein